jgi:hypothetical protein
MFFSSMLKSFEVDFILRIGTLGWLRYPLLRGAKRSLDHLSLFKLDYRSSVGGVITFFKLRRSEEVVYPGAPGAQGSQW